MIIHQAQLELLKKNIKIWLHKPPFLAFHEKVFFVDNFFPRLSSTCKRSQPEVVFELECIKMYIFSQHYGWYFSQFPQAGVGNDLLWLQSTCDA